MLDQQMRYFEFDQSYRTLDVLKQSDWELTELVEDEQGKRWIRKYLTRDPSFGACYERIGELSSMHLPKIEYVYPLGDKTVVIMERIPGQSLFSYVEENGPLAPADAVSILKYVVAGVSDLHQAKPQPIIHRDISPSNIIVDKVDGALVGKLIDFGIAREFKREQSHDTRHWGTDGYASPEQFGFGQTTARSDVYSLGATLYFMLTGKQPQSNMSALLADSSLPNGMAKVIARATNQNPEKRYPTARAFYEAAKSASTNVFAKIPVKLEDQRRPDFGPLKHPRASIACKVIALVPAFLSILLLLKVAPNAFAALPFRQAVAVVVYYVCFVWFFFGMPAFLLANAVELIEKRGIFRRRRWLVVALLVASAAVLFLFGVGVTMWADVPSGTIASV